MAGDPAMHGVVKGDQGIMRLRAAWRAADRDVGGGCSADSWGSFGTWDGLFIASPRVLISSHL